VIPPDSIDRFKIRQYVQSVADDETEDLIGIIEEFIAPDGQCTRHFVEGCKVVIWFPLSVSDNRQYKLTGVNHFTSYVRQQLRLNEGCLIFKVDDIESFNQEDL